MIADKGVEALDGDLFRFPTNLPSFKTNKAYGLGNPRDLCTFFFSFGYMRVGQPRKSVAVNAVLTNGYILTHLHLHKFLYPVSFLNSGDGVSNTQIGRGRKRHIQEGLVMDDEVE